MTALDRSPCPHCCTPMVNGRCPNPNCQMHWKSGGEAITSNLRLELERIAEELTCKAHLHVVDHYCPNCDRNLGSARTKVLALRDALPVETKAEPRGFADPWRSINLIAETRPLTPLRDAVDQARKLSDDWQKAEHGAPDRNAEGHPAGPYCPATGLPCGRMCLTICNRRAEKAEGKPDA